MEENFMFNLYALDTETSGLDFVKNDVVEISIIRMSDDVQKTWHLKPLNPETIDAGALKVNGLKLEDLLHKTNFGRVTYLEPSEVIVDIENWLMEDGGTSEQRIMIAHNVTYDYTMLKQLWAKCNSSDSFPFGRRLLDTFQLEFFMDLCSEQMAEGYSLNNLAKKYGVKNEKAHSSSADTLCLAQIFKKQVTGFKKYLKNV
jgi:DNA polymerase III epsilon subunit-like protein